MTDEQKAKILQTIANMPLPIIVTLMLGGVIYLNHQSTARLIEKVSDTMSDQVSIMQKMEENQRLHNRYIEQRVIPALQGK